jgi:hypothetical protein
MLAMLYSWQEFALGRSIALQLICDHHSRDIPQVLEQLAEEFRGCGLVATPLHQNIQPIPVLIHRPP